MLERKGKNSSNFISESGRHTLSFLSSSAMVGALNPSVWGLISFSCMWPFWGRGWRRGAPPSSRNGGYHSVNSDSAEHGADHSSLQ